MCSPCKLLKEFVLFLNDIRGSWHQGVWGSEQQVDREVWGGGSEVREEEEDLEEEDEEEEEEGFVSPHLSALFLSALFSASSTFSTVAQCKRWSRWPACDSNGSPSFWTSYLFVISYFILNFVWVLNVFFFFFVKIDCLEPLSVLEQCVCKNACFRIKAPVSDTPAT